ncbi:MAG: tRNA dihydrouridine synthase DusB [Chlorobi bacterium]|nr:tRNA dihydrouridine synthase DusB [Chlorobiota bacterium]
MKLGKLDLGSKLFVAPMADVSDAPFRKICKEYGAGLTFTQMVSAKGIVDNEFYALRQFAYSRDEKPIGVQLIGNEPDYLYQAVTEIKRYKPDLIDINFGCSVQNVTKHNLGAAILDNPLLMGELVKAMVSAADDIPVSVKLRLGQSINRVNILESAQVAQDNGASLIFIHARARNSRYKDKPMWEWIKKVKEAVDIPVIGNGSLFTPQDIINMTAETSCDSVMIARGALGNPFIFSRYAEYLKNGVDPGEPSFNEIEKTSIHHCELLSKEYADNIAAIKAKKNIIWYYKNCDGINALIEKIISAKSIENEIEIIHDHTEKLNAGFYPPEDRELINKKFGERVVFWLDK